jgi:YVTN family beta-propeller protein
MRNQRRYRGRSAFRPLPVRKPGGRGLVGPIRMPIVRCLLLLLLIGPLVVWWGGGSPSARADGGAPNLAYIVGGGNSGDHLVAMDIAQRSVAWSVALGGNPQGIVLSADGRLAYIPEASASRVAIVDTRAHQVVGTMAVGVGPQAIAVDPSGGLHWLFVANTNSNSLTVLDADTQRTRTTLAVGQEPVSVAVATSLSGISGSGNTSALELYVANRGSRSLSVITTSDLHTVAAIALPESPCALTIPATGGIAYVATCSGKVLGVGLASHRVLGTLYSGLGGAPGTMDYDAVTGQLYVPVPAMDRVVILRPAGVGADGSLVAPAEPLRVLTVPGAPSAVAITFDGALGFVAERSSGRVVEIDVTNHRILSTVTVAGAPNTIVTGPYPPALNSQTANVVTTMVYVIFALALVIFVVVMVRGNIRDNIKRSRRSD